MNKQLSLLLEDSFQYYRGRRLKKALNTAQIALEFGKNHLSENPGLFQVYLLLSNIYNTNGLYKNDPAFYSKALSALDDVENNLPSSELSELTADLLIARGRVYHNLREFDLSRQLFEEALEIASKLGHTKCLVKSYAGLAQRCLALNDPDATIEISKQIETVLKRANEPSKSQLWSDMYLLFSQAYILKQEYSQSLEMSQALLQISRQTKDVEKEVIALRNIAVVCGVKSNYKIGMLYFLEALDKSESIGYREMTVQIHINIGTLYAHLYNYEEAIRRYENLLNLYADVIDDKTKTVVYNNLGNIHLANDNPETAIDFFEKAYNLSSKSNFSDLMAYSLAQMSRSKLLLDRIEAAKVDALLAKTMYEENGLVNGKQINLLNLGRIAFEEKCYQEAQDLAFQAIELAKELKDDSAEIKAYALLTKIFKAKADFEKALEYQERYAKIQESFSKLQRSRHNLDMEIRHAVREKQKEIELLTKENEFQSQLIQKSQHIAWQNEELLRANDDLRQFAYIASHDLKEPLRMIGSFSQVIHKLAKPHLSEADQEYFKYVRDGVNRMNNLLDGLLRYSTINQSQEEFMDVPLNDVIAQSMANLKIRLIETNAIIERGELPVLKGTQQLYVQLFQNLISNALKFVKQGTQPYVKLSAEETAEAHIISITDNGIGISPENQTKIFEIFKRLHHQSEYEGTGIGLAICQKIAKRLGGSIRVKSALGEGTTFCLVMPKDRKEK